MIAGGVLELSGVARSWGGRTGLRRTDLRLERGEVVALFGANGAGKTTLLRLAATLLRPSSGEVLSHGTPVRRDLRAWRRRLAHLGHTLFLYEDLTVAENLALHLRLRGLSATPRDVDEHLGRAGLAARRDERAGTLSRGLQQRAGLAQALAGDPAVLLLDEPFTGLDPETAERLARRIREAADAGAAALVSSHDLAAGIALADRFVLLEDGRIVAAGACSELRSQPPRHLHDLRHPA